MNCARSLAFSGARRVLGRPGPFLRYLTSSSVRGPTHPPLDERTLPAYYANEILSKHSSRPALIAKAEKARAHGGPPQKSDARHLAWDFQELDQHVAALARGLLNLGVNKGDRVGVVMGNTSAYAALQWACARIGAILATINPAYRAHELVDTLNLVSVSTLIVVPHIRSSNYLRMLVSSAPSILATRLGETIDIPELPHLRRLLIVDDTGLEGSESVFRKEIKDSWIRCGIDMRETFLWAQSGKEQAALEQIAREEHADDVINLQFTSGTTGAPKAVSLTHRNLLNNGLSIGRCMRLTSQDVVCNVPPLFHCFGLVLGNLAAWTHGSCILYPSPIYDPRAIVDALETDNCTALHGVPTHFLGVLKEVESRGARISGVRTGIAAGSSVPIELMKKLIDVLGMKDLTIAYGMTETSPVTFQTTPDDPLQKRVETVGKVQPHASAKLIDTDGKVVPVGVPGELCVRGYMVQKGYWNDEAQTAEVMIRHEDDGEIWMHTGDEGIMDDDGYMSIVGRRKDIIIRGGENLFPVQIENVLHEHPHVVECAAVSVPDPVYGEVVGAWIVPRFRDGKILPVTREELRKWVGERMNPQNAPTWVWFTGDAEHGTPDELPKTASGKVMKHLLRDWSKELQRMGHGRANAL